MDRRPSPSSQLDEVLNRLTEANQRGERTFDTKQKGMMFAAALGFAAGRRLKPESKASGIRWDVFENAHDDGFINALAVVVTGDLAVLGEERAEERIDIFEEYAHGGLDELQRLTFGQDGDALDNLIRKTLESRVSESEIPGIDQNILRDLLG